MSSFLMPYSMSFTAFVLKVDKEVTSAILLCLDYNEAHRCPVSWKSFFNSLDHAIQANIPLPKPISAGNCKLNKLRLF